MKSQFSKITNSEKETLEFGRDIFKKIPSDVKLIIIDGDLSSGKTVITKGIAESLGIKEKVNSPTFGYKKEYSKLIHYDIYLIKDTFKPKDLGSLITEDLSKDKKIVIEWGKKVSKLKNTFLIKIKILGENKRKIEGFLL